MGWQNGTFRRMFSWTADAAAGYDILSDRMDSDTNDIVGGINNTLTRDGQNLPIANLPMSGFKHTGVAQASAATDYARWDQVVPISGNPTINGNLTVNGSQTVTGNLGVTGTSTLSGQVYCNGVSANGAIACGNNITAQYITTNGCVMNGSIIANAGITVNAGGVNIAAGGFYTATGGSSGGDFNIAGNSTVNGRVVVGDFQSNANVYAPNGWLQGRYVTTTAADANGYGVAINNNGSIYVSGGGTISGNLGVGGTATVGALSTGGAANVGSLGVTGAANIGGTASVGGLTTGGNVTAGSLTSNGGASVAGNMTINGTATVGALSTGGAANVGSLGVTGAANVGGTATLGGLTVNLANINQITARTGGGGLAVFNGLVVNPDTGQLDAATFTADIQVNGDIGYTGSLLHNSDRRLKTAIESFTKGLAAIRELRPASWEWNNSIGTVADGRRHYGLIADEVETVLPEMVGQRRGYATLDDQPLLMALVTAVQELAAKLEALSAGAR